MEAAAKTNLKKVSFAISSSVRSRTLVNFVARWLGYARVGREISIAGIRIC